jgi:hypothetical protein
MKRNTSPPVKHSAVKRAAEIITSPPAGSQGIKSSGMFDNNPPKIQNKKKSEMSISSPTTTKLPTPYSIKKIRASLSSASKSKKRQDDDSDIESSSNISDDIQVMMKREISELRMKVQSMIKDNQSANGKPVDPISPITNHDMSQINDELIIPKEPVTVNPIENRKVSKREWTNTSQSISAFFLGNKITSMTPDSFRVIELLRGSLSTTGLETLLDGHRPKPVITEQNPFGFTQRRIITVEVNNECGVMSTKEVMLDDDDIFHYKHDQGRLYHAVMEIFDKSLHYLVLDEIKTQNGFEIYVKIMAHLNGQKAHDADRARKRFNNYKMDERITFKMEHSRFSEIITILEYAQKLKLSESEKMAFLSTRLLVDNRLGLKEVMIQAQMNNYTYDATIQKLITINMEMPDSQQTVKMATMSNDQYCFAYNKNPTSCKFGTECRYLHKVDPDHDAKKKIRDATFKKKKSSTNNNDNSNSMKQPQENKSNNNSKLVTKENRAYNGPSVGDPRGTKSDKNPEGWSIKQMYAKRLFERNNNNESIKSLTTTNKNENGNENENENVENEYMNLSNFSSWSDSTAPEYQPVNDQQSNISIKVIIVGEFIPDKDIIPQKAHHIPDDDKNNSDSENESESSSEESSEHNDSETSESDTEYPSAPDTSHKRFTRMSIYNEDSRQFSSQKRVRNNNN